MKIYVMSIKMLLCSSLIYIYSRLLLSWSLAEVQRRCQIYSSWLVETGQYTKGRNPNHRKYNNKNKQKTGISTQNHAKRKPLHLKAIY